MVYVLLADGFEEVEALTPVDILRRCGVQVRTVGVAATRVTGAHNITVEADIAIDDVDTAAMQVLMLPGGPGHTNIEQSDKAQALIDFSAKHNICIAAICAAPSILGKKGLLRGKHATCFPGYEQFLSGAKVSADKVVTDGNIITAKGAGAASDFGFAIAARLVGADAAEQVRAAMQY